MNTNEKINDHLKDVIERNFDAYKGYEKAAEKVKNPQLAGAFRNQAVQRKQFALDLETAAHVMGAEAREKMEGGTFEGSLHRTWMDIKTAFSSNKDEAVLEECIRGEKDALDEYNELINDTDFSGQPYSLISKQRDTIQSCITELQRLENIVD